VSPTSERRGLGRSERDEEESSSREEPRWKHLGARQVRRTLKGSRNPGEPRTPHRPACWRVNATELEPGSKTLKPSLTGVSRTVVSRELQTFSGREADRGATGTEGKKVEVSSRGETAPDRGQRSEGKELQERTGMKQGPVDRTRRKPSRG